MDADEQEIYYYLRAWKGDFISMREICRRAGGKTKFHEDPEWAKPVVLRMVEKDILESDPAGHFRVKPVDSKDGRKKRWVSPQIARILRESGKDFGDLIISDETDDAYYPTA